MNTNMTTIFLIKYVVLNVEGRVIEEKEMRVKNKENEFVAKCSLEVYLKKIHPDFDRLIIKSCIEDAMSKILKYVRRY